MKEILEILILSGMVVSFGIYIYFMYDKYQKGNVEITLLDIVGAFALALTSWVGICMMVFDEYLENVIVFKAKEVKK